MANPAKDGDAKQGAFAEKHGSPATEKEFFIYLKTQV